MILFPRPGIVIDVERGWQLTLAVRQVPEAFRPSKGKAMIPTSKQRKQLERDNRRFPEALQRQTISPNFVLPPGLMEVWRSRAFLVQVYAVSKGIVCLSVCRTTHNGESWSDGIAWEDMQRLKRECGRGDLDAVEVYPRDSDIVNMSNMRHLFVFDELLPYAWRHVTS